MFIKKAGLTCTVPLHSERDMNDRGEDFTGLVGKGNRAISHDNDIHNQ